MFFRKYKFLDEEAYVVQLSLFDKWPLFEIWRLFEIWHLFDILHILTFYLNPLSSSQDHFCSSLSLSQNFRTKKPKAKTNRYGDLKRATNNSNLLCVGSVLFTVPEGFQNKFWVDKWFGSCHWSFMATSYFYYLTVVRKLCLVISWHLMEILLWSYCAWIDWLKVYLLKWMVQ